jgi:hypothetical protein
MKGLGKKIFIASRSSDAACAAAMKPTSQSAAASNIARRADTAPALARLAQIPSIFFSRKQVVLAEKTRL